MNTQPNSDTSQLPAYAEEHLREILALAREPLNSQEAVFRTLLSYAESLHERGYWRGYRLRLREELP